MKTIKKTIRTLKNTYIERTLTVVEGAKCDVKRCRYNYNFIDVYQTTDINGKVIHLCAYCKNVVAHYNGDDLKKKEHTRGGNKWENRKKLSLDEIPEMYGWKNFTEQEGGSNEKK